MSSNTRVKYDHCDCALVVGVEFPHVSAALQVLLHVPHFRQFLASDIDGSTHCKSLLKCLVCQFQYVVKTALKNAATLGIADATVLGNKWSNLSSTMGEDKKRDPYEVLCLFLNRMRMDSVKGLELVSIQDLATVPISKIFYTSIVRNGSCCGCGKFRHTKYSVSFCVEKFSEDISNDINSMINAETEEMCIFCQVLQATYKANNVILPSTLIIHSKQSSPNFRWKNDLTIDGVSFEFLGCIVDDGDPFYVNLCPDGKLRMYKGIEVSVIAPGRFAISQFLLEAKLTLIYIKKQITTEKVQPLLGAATSVTAYSSCSQRQRPKCNNFKVIGFPDTSMLDPEPTRKGKSTQTQVKIFCHVSTQTEEETKPKKTKIVSYESCKLDERFKFFTGLSMDDFEALYNLIGGDDVVRSLKLKYDDTTPTKTIKSTLSGKDRLFMLLLRLRRGYPGEEIGFLFAIDPSYAYRICYAMTQLVYRTFKSMQQIMFVSAKQQRKGQPKVMHPFKNLRVILDGMSLFIQTPSNFQQQGNTYSNYKKHNVLLFAVGISSHGATIFCSDGFEGSTSDKESIIKSGLLDMLDKGDGVMTDRGYDLTAEFQAKGCHFYKPPSLGDRSVFTAEEEILTKAIAAARIYVEHAIADIKDWKILHGVLPLNMLPQWSNIVYILAFMRNFNPNRIHDKKFVRKPQDEDEFV